MLLQVTSVEQLCTGVKSFELRAPDASILPHFEPGAHIRLTIPALTEADPTRAYSLASDPADLARYEIAVLHVEDGSGGSAILHKRVHPVDLLEVSLPRNDFPWDDCAQRSILVAGGIGVTPILSLTRKLVHCGRPFEVHYVGRGPDRMPYRQLLAELAQGRAHFYVSRAEFNLAGALDQYEPGTHVCVCGPHSLIEATRETARRAGFPRADVHFEPFGYRRMPADRQVMLELRNSGLTVLADVGRPLLEAMESLGVWVPADCRRGECGTCVTNILEGEGTHRDHCLTPEQRSAVICPCVFWAAS